MTFLNRLGLSFMVFTMYAQLTILVGDSFTDLQKGALHMLFMLGYITFMLSNKRNRLDN